MYRFCKKCRAELPLSRKDTHCVSCRKILNTVGMRNSDVELSPSGLKKLVSVPIGKLSPHDRAFRIARRFQSFLPDVPGACLRKSFGRGVCARCEHREIPSRDQNGYFLSSTYPPELDSTTRREIHLEQVCELCYVEDEKSVLTAPGGSKFCKGCREYREKYLFGAFGHCVVCREDARDIQEYRQFGDGLSSSTRLSYVEAYKVYLPQCWVCRKETGGTSYFVPGAYYREKDRYDVQVFQTCRECFMMEDAVLEAEETKRRFTKVGVLNDEVVDIDLGDFRHHRQNQVSFKDRFGYRCACGGVTVLSLDKRYCVQCSIKMWGLSAEEYRLKMNRKLINQLKEVILNGSKKHQDQYDRTTP